MGLKGSLSELPLPDLVQMTALGGKTGLLTVCDASGALAGALVFRAGLLVGASCGHLSGASAFLAVLAVSSGTFDFDPQGEVGEAADDEALPLESLLIEGMRRLDELQQLRRELPSGANVTLIGGHPEGEAEAALVARLGLGPQNLGEVVAAVSGGGSLDERVALEAMERLVARGIVRVEAPAAGPEVAEERPQPELEP